MEVLLMLVFKLPDELLQTILSKLSTEEAVRTSRLSSRWVDVWKWRSHLVLDMNKVLETTPNEDLHRVSVELARSMTKPVILNMMIETSLFPPTKKFNAEAAVAKLINFLNETGLRHQHVSGSIHLLRETKSQLSWSPNTDMGP
ncbi:hypothetical protein YC2023_090578 [Brassica napus]